MALKGRTCSWRVSLDQVATGLTWVTRISPQAQIFHSIRRVFGITYRADECHVPYTLAHGDSSLVRIDDAGRRRSSLLPLRGLPQEVFVLAEQDAL